MNNNNYSLVLKQATALLETESDPIANAANLASLIFYNINDLNWAGFYFFNRDAQELVLGPFSGQVACTRIAVGSGVCGSAYQQNETLVVQDVHQFEGHIACDAASESEIVVPFKTSMVSGVLDIDSPQKSRFGEAEKELFESLALSYVNSLGN